MTMRRESFVALLRLRALAVDEAKRELAECLARETAALNEVSNHDRMMAAEAEAAFDLGAGDDAVEAYARWLPTGRRAGADASRRLDMAEEAVAQARGALNLARSAHKPVEQALEAYDTELRIMAARKAQNELDDLPAGRKREPDHQRTPMDR